MQMECCGISLIFSETQYDKLMLCFSHLALMFREKKNSGFGWHFFFFFELEVKGLTGKIKLMKIYMTFSDVIFKMFNL